MTGLWPSSRGEHEAEEAPRWVAVAPYHGHNVDKYSPFLPLSLQVRPQGRRGWRYLSCIPPFIGNAT